MSCRARRGRRERKQIPFPEAGESPSECYRTTADSDFFYFGLAVWGIAESKELEDAGWDEEKLRELGLEVRTKEVQPNIGMFIFIHDINGTYSGEDAPISIFQDLLEHSPIAWLANQEEAYRVMDALNSLLKDGGIEQVKELIELCILEESEGVPLEDNAKHLFREF
ncbi:hypothetical protein TWF751_002415 [Orbilia oligospora]|nr:hypothetical protein TWF751_002415 [Orbilia oligospora]